MAENYKIELGIKLKDNELDSIKGQIKNIEKDKINIQLDTSVAEKQVESLKKELQSLGTANKNNNALNINTKSVEDSLVRVADAVTDIRKALGTIDNKSDMKSLLDSINQITASLGKASDETQTLVSSLNALSKKDFSFNIGIDLNNKKSTLAYGREARQSVLPELKSQINYLNDLFDKELQGITRSKKINIDQSKVGLLGKVNKIKMDYTVAGGSSSSMIGSLEAQEKYINQMVELAKASDINLDGFYSQHSKSASQLVNELTGVSQATEVVEEQTQKLKNILGSGIDSESLTQILNDLNEINTAIKYLASDTSLGGLTQSFDNLSNTLKEITRDISTFAQAVNSGLANTSNIGTSIVNEVKTASGSLESAANQVGKKIGDSVEDGVKSSLNIDDVIAKEVKGLMKAEGISTRGNAGKQAEEEISTAFRGYLNDGSDAGIRKVTDALLNNKRVVDESKKSYQELDKYVRSINDGNVKVLLDKDIVNEYGDDFKEMQKLFGKGFVTRVGKNDTFMSFDEWFSGLPDTVTNTLSDDYNRINAFGEMFDQLRQQRSKAYMSTQEMISRGEFSFDEVESSIRSAVERVNALKQTSKQAADSTVQSEKEKQQAYQETLNKLEEVNQKISEYDNKIKEINTRNDSLRELGFSDDQIEEAKRVETEDYNNQFKEKYGTDVDSLKQQKAELLAVAQAANQTGNALDGAFEGAESGAKETTGVIEKLKSTLQSMRVDRSSIDAIIKDVEELGFTAKDASVAMKNGNFDITVNGVDSIGRAITEIRHLDSATGEITGISRKISQSLSETDNFVKQQKRSVTDLTNQINELNRKAIDPNTSKPIKDESHLNSLKDKYNEVVAAIKKMGDASSSTFDEERNAVKTLISEYKSLTREYKNAETVATSLRSKDVDTVKATYASKLDVLISKMKDSGVYSAGFEKGAENLRSILSGSVDANGLVSFLNGLDKLDAGYKRAAQSAKSFEQAQTYGKRASGLESEIKNLQRISPEINQFEAEINGSKVSVQSLLKDLGQVKTKADFNSVKADLQAFKKAAEASGIAIRETAQQAKSIKDIKIKLSDTGFDGFEQEVARAHSEAEKLEGVYDSLEASLKELDIAMAKVYSADQSGDVKSLIVANEEYEASLKRVNSQLKLYQQAEKQAYNAEILSQKKASLNSEMEIWLKENTRAANEFGDEIRRLQASLDGLDANGVRLAGQQFKNITKQAQAMGKTGLTVFDRLKSKAKEYAAYLSTAEIFMWAEQAFREMFNTVKEIDTAMTGLYRVTDLTAAEYDSLFNEMIGSAKEYGATLNDIINATTDWVRAGFDANTSLGLAEVTTMYQHISDLDYDTAAENLITAYNGFKDELNGAFDGDQVAAVEYIADIFNELDNTFAVTSAGLGEALTRSASALDLAGNSIQETAGMVTGIVEVTQDPEKAGSALKVLSLRLRGKTLSCLHTRKVCMLCTTLKNENIEDSYIRQSARVA